MKTRTERYRHEHRAQSFLGWVFAGILGLAAVLFVMFGWFSPVYINDASMSPTLSEGDTVIYDRLYGHFHEYQRGDIVVYRDPETQALLIKRVIAVAGDTIETVDGEVYVNGERIDEPYLTPDRIGGQYIRRQTVPEGCVYVLGDNRAVSRDSRYETVGAIPLYRIVGKARMVIFPFANAHLI